MTESEKYIGIFQDPVQLAQTLLHLGTLGISSYLELGVFSGWTHCLVAAFLIRHVPPGQTFTGLAVDHRNTYMAASVRQLIEALGSGFHMRTELLP